MMHDVPSPIDLRDANDATQWALEVNIKRPWRQIFFDLYIDHIRALQLDSPQILEISAGPGHLAKVLFTQIPDMKYTALDFSDAMHDLSRQHLGEISTKVDYVTTDFKSSDWFENLNGITFDVVIIHQALHELRHKNHAYDFHEQVKKHLLSTHALYLVTDHLYAADAMQNNQLFMSLDEHLVLFETLDFNDVEILKHLNGLCAFKIRN